MKRIIIYFLLCALVLGCAAGCIDRQPGAATDPSGQEVPGSETAATGLDLNTLPTADRELYILTGQSDIVYYTDRSNNNYGFYIYARQPLDVYSIAVTLPISHSYQVSVRECPLKGIETDPWRHSDERSFSSNAFSYPLYLAYRGADFIKLARLEEEQKSLLQQFKDAGYDDMLAGGDLTLEEYLLLKEPYHAAKTQYEACLDAYWQEYISLTEEDLPQFYVYRVNITFDCKPLEEEESFTGMQITVGDQVYQQQIGRITLKGELKKPAQLDWYEDWSSPTDGILGSGNSVSLYNDGVHCVQTLYRFTADRYKLLERITMANPAHCIELVWVEIMPQTGPRSVTLWDMSEPFEVYPGDLVTIYVAYREDGMQSPGYQTMMYSFLEYTTDGERFCKFSQCEIGVMQQHYVWYAVLIHELDLESYYRDYYYYINEPWRWNADEDPLPDVP